MVINVGIFELTFSSQGIALKLEINGNSCFKIFFSLVTKTHHLLEDIEKAKMRLSPKLLSVA